VSLGAGKKAQRDTEGRPEGKTQRERQRQRLTDAVKSQGMQKIAGWKVAWNGAPLEPLEGTNPDCTLILHFWPSEL
jgi:hypothetical protein